MPRNTLLDFFDDRIRSDRPFLVYDGGYRTCVWSYAEIRRAARAFADRLRAHGLAPGDRVLLWGENRAEWIVAFWGCLLARAVAVPIDLRSSPDLAGRVARIVSARLVVAGENIRLPPLDGIAAWKLEELLAGGVGLDHPPPETPLPRTPPAPARTTARRIDPGGGRPCRDHLHVRRHGRAQGSPESRTRTCWPTSSRWSARSGSTRRTGRPLLSHPLPETCSR